MNLYGHMSAKTLVAELCKDLQKAPEVEQESWHAMPVKGMKHLVARELTNFIWESRIPSSISELQRLIAPNLPWAEDHFQERVSRIPYNPSPSEAYWPFAMEGNATHKDKDEKFSHTYPERMWPKHAGGHPTDWQPPAGDYPIHMGIRFNYGDLDDVVALLAKEPTTRQAYLPIWFPEDTGATEGQRLPCSLGYHFTIRDEVLNMSYYMRSCDFVRHFRDDVYMAMRLGQWVAAEVSRKVDTTVYPGQYFMTIASLHAFHGDMTKLRRNDV